MGGGVGGGVDSPRVNPGVQCTLHHWKRLQPFDPPLAAHEEVLKEDQPVCICRSVVLHLWLLLRICPSRGRVRAVAIVEGEALRRPNRRRADCHL